MMSSREEAPSSWGWSSAWGWAADEDDSEAGLIERLSAEFAPLANADTVTAIVQQCRREIDITQAPSPEAVEQLARQRLQDTTGRYAITAVANTGPGAGSSAYVIIQLLSE
jgi:hypothetical protein